MQTNDIEQPNPERYLFDVWGYAEGATCIAKSLKDQNNTK